MYDISEWLGTGYGVSNVDLILILTLFNYRTMNKLFNFLSIGFITCKMRIIFPTS